MHLVVYEISFILSRLPPRIFPIFSALFLRAAGFVPLAANLKAMVKRKERHHVMKNS